MRLYRIFPYLRNAAADEPGGALFRPPGGAGRADSPTDRYRCLYTASAPEGAIAEAFGRFDRWDRQLIEMAPATPTLPASRFAVVGFELVSAPIRNLDDARVLLEEGLRPSQVVSRDLSVTQAWSSRIHDRAGYAGVRWWSYYNPDWAVAAVWDIPRIDIAEPPRLLTVDDPSVVAAARAIVRSLVTA